LREKIMRHAKALVAAPVLVVLMGSVAHAALTAEQVWGEWKAAVAEGGASLEAATEVAGEGELALNGVTLKAPDGSVTLTVSELVLSEDGEGGVIASPGDIALTFAEDTGVQEFDIVHEGLAVGTYEGEVGRDWSVAADSLGITFAGTSDGALPSAEGQPPAVAQTAGNVTFLNLSGGYAVAAGDNNLAGVELSADTLRYDITSADPSIGTDSRQQSETAGIAITGELTLPRTLALAALTTPEAFRTALEEGLAFSLTAEQGASTGTMSDKNPGMPMDITFTSGAGSTTVEGDIASILVSSAGESLEMTLVSPMLPAPQFRLTSGPLEVGVEIPVVATPEPGPYGLIFSLSGVSVNEEAWALVDPNKTLPRDPADLDIDLGGTVVMDMLALAAAEGAGMTEVAPPEPRTLDVRSLAVKVAGAALSATGAFTFDNTPVAQGGAPIPVGTGEVTLSGGNRLIDGLIAIGMLSEEDAMGARMMMGAFMSPGEGEDTLVSKIEAKADGQILVNGQRVQ
jgi:hypothetical protein